MSGSDFALLWQNGGLDLPNHNPLLLLALVFAALAVLVPLVLLWIKKVSKEKGDKE